MRRKRQPPDYAPVRSTVWEQEKNTSATLAHNQYNMNTQDLQQRRGVGDGGNPAQASSHPVLQPFSALVTDPPVRLGVQSGEGEG